MNLVDNQLDISSLLKRIEASKIPGIYEVEFIGFSLANGYIKSTAVYLIEPISLGPYEQTKRRLEIYNYYLNLFSNSLAKHVFSYNECPFSIDPSFKSSDSDFTLRLEPQVDFNRINPFRYLEYLIEFAFPKNMSIFKTAKNIGVPARIAVEIDTQCFAGRKIRLYYYDNNRDENEVFSGVSINEKGLLSTIKHYYGIFGNIDKHQNLLKKNINQILFNKIVEFANSYEKHLLSLIYFACEKSDYGVDSKLYFRNDLPFYDKINIK